MSHFAVMVVGDNVEEQLAPFQENNMDYMRFIPYTESEVDELRHDYESGCEYGRFPTFDNFMEATNRRDKGVYGAWENPNAKWDWWVTGKKSRYRDRLLLKDGYRACTAKKKDIDLGLMRAFRYAEAAEEWASWERISSGLPSHSSWEDVRDGHKGDLEKARGTYWSQPAVAAWKDANPDSFMDDPDKYLIGRKAFIEQKVDSALSAFAVLKDGDWKAKGDMGWWAMVSNEKKDRAWIDEFNSIFESIPDDATITIVDCHI